MRGFIMQAAHFQPGYSRPLLGVVTVFLARFRMPAMACSRWVRSAFQADSAPRAGCRPNALCPVGEPTRRPLFDARMGFRHMRRGGMPAWRSPDPGDVQPRTYPDRTLAIVCSPACTVTSRHAGGNGTE
jgi:hypothetical protein